MQNVSRKENEFFEVCGQCKISCCQNARPPLTLKRRRIIEIYLKKHKILIENPFAYTMYAFPREDKEGYCLFYDKKTRKCQVHRVKPETCVAGPVTFDINIKTKKIEFYLKKEEICPLAGRLYRDLERLKTHLELAKKEIHRLVKELEPEALKTILKIEEPETFKIDEDHIEKEVLDKLI